MSMTSGIPALTSGSSYAITNVNTSTFVYYYYDNVTEHILGNIGTNTSWTAIQSNNNPWSWMFSTYPDIYLGYQGTPSNGTPIMGVQVQNDPMPFNVYPVSNGQNSVIIFIPNTTLALQISDENAGITMVMSPYENSATTQMWNFQLQVPNV